MKKILSLNLLSLLILASCGGGGSQTKLEVSKGFLASNTGFDGGVIVVGKKSQSTESFSIDLSTGTETSIKLSKGTWTFSAIGWDGGPSPYKLFGGSPYCANLQVNLINDQETVELTLKQSGCNTTAFTAGHVDTGSTPNTIKQLGVVTTCNSFFFSNVSSASTPSSEMVTANIQDNYCNFLADDLKTKVKGFKIYAARKNNLEPHTLGMSSECISTLDSVLEPQGSGKPYQGKNLRLPFASIPFIFMTYEDETCSKPLARYPFVNGLAGSYSDKFDHLLIERYSSPHMRLVLPGNDLRRGMSPLMAIMPSVKCWTGSTEIKCNNIPAGLSTMDFHGYAGISNNIFLKDVTSCSPTPVPSGSVIGPINCSLSNDGANISFYGSSPGTGTLMAGGKIYNIKISANTLFDQERDKTQARIIELIGQTDTLNLKPSFYNMNQDNGDHDPYGAISRVREMFSAQGAGGIFPITDPNISFAQACLNLNGTKEVSLYNEKEMMMETYKVAIHNSPSEEPGPFYCDIADTGGAGCTSSSDFNKRMLIYDYKLSAVAPTMAIEFHCSIPLGKMESYEMEIEGNRKHENHEVIKWNNDVSAAFAHQRFDQAAWDKDFEYNGSSWAIKSERRHMARLTKLADRDYEISSYEFNAYHNGSTWEQGLASHQIKVLDTLACYRAENDNLTNADRFYILSNSAVASTPHFTGTPSNSFDIVTSWPQINLGAGSCTDFSALPGGAGSLILDSHDFRLNALDGTSFTSAFGGPFLTAP